MANVELSLAELSAQERYFILASLVVPRPIAWVSTVSIVGQPNIAPHSFFNAVSTDPPIVYFASTRNSRHDPMGIKDTLRNIRDTKEFVINVVSQDLLEPMIITAIDCPPEIDEFTLAGLSKAASHVVRPPRVENAKAAMECRLRQMLTMGDSTMIFGDVLHVGISDSVWVDGRVNISRLQPVGRLAGSEYAMVNQVCRHPRLIWDDAAASGLVLQRKLVEQ
jgi:flavin reductase (DIM6/NTAB) family NADH-FMN oxidoreductase RutF